jgi:MOSC domain-containing protein YiiM
MDAKHLTMEELEKGLDTIRQSPREQGVLAMIVRRPQAGQRQVMEEGQLDLEEGLVGDDWRALNSKRTTIDDPSFRDNQLTLMNARVIGLLAQEQERWPLAGDQLYVDLDLSVENLPPGTRLAIGGAVVEVSALPHTGCKQFMARFGLDALEFVNSKAAGKPLRLRGLNARVVQPGVVRTGDVVKKIVLQG